MVICIQAVSRKSGHLGDTPCILQYKYIEHKYDTQCISDLHFEIPLLD